MKNIKFTLSDGSIFEAQITQGLIEKLQREFNVLDIKEEHIKTFFSRILKNELDKYNE